MPDVTFGSQLRAFRQRAGFETIHAFCDALSNEGIVYSDEALGHWERDARRPPARQALFEVLKLLTAREGIKSLAEVNALLYALDWRDLNSEESSIYFPGLAMNLPNNLPHLSIYRPVVGRTDFIIDLAKRLTDEQSLPVIAVSGLGGIGKTAVAYDAVRSVMNTSRFARLAWVSAKSEDFEGARIRRKPEQTDLMTLLVSIANQLGVSLPLRVTQDFVNAQIQSVVGNTPCLIVLDNLETLDTARDVAKLLYNLVVSSGAASSSRVLLTSRERLVDEPFVLDIPLGGLEQSDSLELLRQEAERRNSSAILNASLAMLERTHQITGGMPLALILLVSQTLLGIALDKELDRLQKAVNERELYQFIYFDLWAKLNEDAQKLLVGTAAFAVPAQREHVIRVSKIELDQFETLVMELTHSCLLDVVGLESDMQRYSMHPMTRWFVNAPLADLWRRGKNAIIIAPDPTQQ